MIYAIRILDWLGLPVTLQLALGDLVDPRRKVWTQNNERAVVIELVDPGILQGVTLYQETERGWRAL